MKKIVGIASKPERKEGLIDTLHCLSPQVDHIYVWLNSYQKKPIVDLKNITFHMGEDVGATGKIKVLDFIEDTDFYFFMADDDIIYPTDYVSHNLKYYNSGSILSSHGKIFESLPTKSFNHGDISGYYFGGEILENKQIHAAGTGVCVMDSTVVKQIPYDKFLSNPNMLDIWISAWAHLYNIPMFILPHTKNWLIPNTKINQLNSIWETTKHKEDEFRTNIFNHYISLSIKK
jgi:hypothetical protein